MADGAAVRSGRARLALVALVMLGAPLAVVAGGVAGPPSAFAVTTGAEYVPVTPCRLVDTRVAGGAFASGDERWYQVKGSEGLFASQGGNPDGCGIPEEAVAVEASVSAVTPGSNGFMRVWPSGTLIPTATFLNFTKSQSITNTGTIKLGEVGEYLNVMVKSFATSTHYVIDVQGYFTETAPGAVYVSVTPCRVVDTRLGGGALGNGVQRSFQVTGTGPTFAAQGGKPDGCGIPVDAVAVESSVSAVTPGSNGFMRAWAAGTPLPTATFLNFTKSQSITNTGTIPLASSGATQLTIKNFASPTHYVIDIQGYFTDTGPGAVYVPVTPCRVVDTRLGGGALGNAVQRSFQVTGTGPTFAAQGGKAGGCGIPVDAVAVETSVSAVTPGSNGFMRAWPAGTPLPTATFLNFTKSQSITNTGTIPLGSSGGTQLTIKNFASPTQYVIDIQGYFTIPT